MANIEQIMRDKLRELKELRNQGFEYAYGFKRTASTSDLLEKYTNLKPGEATKDSYSLAGRVMGKRIHGKLMFLDLEDACGKIQLFFEKTTLSDKFDFAKKYIDIGDIVGIKGEVFRTRKGELSIWVKEFQLLAKALRPLPEKWHGLKDVEERYRQRYLDMLMNPDVRQTFVLKAKIVDAIRSTFKSLGFIEVETPILQPVYGGAFAKPFETYYHALEQKVFLRIAPELYLKRLLVGGFEKVFEIGRCFRNESIDAKHNPEFTQAEAYMAYADYRDIMEVTKQVLKNAAKVVGKKLRFDEMTMLEAVRKHVGSDAANDPLAFCREQKLELPKETFGYALNAIFEEFVEKKLDGVFVTHYPVEISPLAKISRRNPRFVERFEFFVKGLEVANGYSELNDPIEQYKRFKEQEELRKKRLDEVMPMDKDFVRALEYGMPPAAGVGIGIERLAMVLLDKESIKEVIPFPHVRPEEEILLASELFDEI